MTRDPRAIVLAVAFLAMIFGVPLEQASFDIEDEMPVQALELFERSPTEKNLREFEDALEENSWVEELGRELFQVARYVAIGELGEKASEGEDGWFFYTPGLRYLREPYFRHPHSESFGQADPVEVIVDFAAQLEARGIELLVVPVPGKGSIYPDWATGGLELDPEVYAHTTRLREELEERGVATLDLHAAFLAARAADDAQLYMKSDTHWTGQGVRIAARALADRLVEEGWVTRTEPGRYRRTEVEILRRGDVLEMTRIPDRERFFAEEKVTVWRVDDAAAQEFYTDDPDSSVLILGDSFSRVFQTDAPKSAGLIANLAYELGAPVASIVNDGGASTLVREQLARRVQMLEGKKVVVWEFVERDVRFGMKGWRLVALDSE